MISKLKDKDGGKLVFDDGTSFETYHLCRWKLVTSLVDEWWHLLLMSDCFFIFAWLCFQIDQFWFLLARPPHFRSLFCQGTHFSSPKMPCCFHGKNGARRVHAIPLGWTLVTATKTTTSKKNGEVFRLVQRFILNIFQHRMKASKQKTLKKNRKEPSKQ